MIYLVTAVSRPDNLPKVYRSIRVSLERSTFAATWVIVVDAPGDLPPDVEGKLSGGSFEVKRLVCQTGRYPYGIPQKNLGIDFVVRNGGFYHCVDDDNLVHPELFAGLGRAMRAYPEKKAFVLGQQRWDSIGNLTASPDRMEYGKIDNTMFVVHADVIGGYRYDLSRSGREDFHLFRKLFDLHRSEFVFIPEILAYYNYLKYNSKPPEVGERELRTPGTLGVVSDPGYAHKMILSGGRTGRPPGIVRIALYSSKRERCGISTYTSALGKALAELGHDVRYWGSQPPHDGTFDEIRAWEPDVFHVQHEASIMPPEEVLEKQAALTLKAGVKIVVTLHTESSSTLGIARRISGPPPGVIILHRPTPAMPDAVVIPMPCTVFGVLPDRLELRRRFGFPESAFVISTVGFMIPWKDHPKIVETMVPWLAKHPDVYVQVIASEHFNEDLRQYAGNCRLGIERACARLGGGRIRHVDGYPSDLELVERLVMSDLGYVWCPFDTGSSSAAAAQFVTARCPLVATDSSHYAFLGDGLVRGPKSDMESFVELIQNVAESPELLEKLRLAQWKEYRERNYIETARKHLDLYGR